MRLQENAVQNARLFLRYLTEQMHERVPGSLVLWYDSVTEDGELKWQNELNPSNRWSLFLRLFASSFPQRQCDIFQQ